MIHTDTRNIAIGKEGEKIAENFLRKKGYKILLKNYRSPLGEIDLVCLHDGAYIFTEVKTSSSLNFGPPELRVDWRKQKQIIHTALAFLKQRGKLSCDCRFDVVSILLIKNEDPRIEHIENAFEAI